MIEQSLEHIIPDELESQEITGSETLSLHINRYRFASAHIISGLILDFACGSGYGSYLLATESNKKVEIIAADRNREVISYASSRYAHSNIQFLVADDHNIFSMLPALNNIVCIETIEHLHDPKMFIDKLSGKLNKGGRFIASVPITISKDANPFHQHDFTILKFKALFPENQFKLLNEFLQVQPYSLSSVFLKKEKRMGSMRKNLISYYITHPVLFIHRIASILKHGFVNKYFTAVLEKL